MGGNQRTGSAAAGGRSGGGGGGGLDPRVWGGGAWGFLHGWAWKAKEGLTRNEVERYAQLIAFFGSTLPCADCRRHFAELLLHMPLQYPQVYSRDTLFRWTYDAHKTVNDRLGAPTPPYEQAYAYFERLEREAAEGKGCGTGGGCRVSLPPPDQRQAGGRQTASPSASPSPSPSSSPSPPSPPDALARGAASAGGKTGGDFPLAAVLAISLGVVVAAAIAIGVTAAVRANNSGAKGRRSGRAVAASSSSAAASSRE